MDDQIAPTQIAADSGTIQINDNLPAVFFPVLELNRCVVCERTPTPP